MLLGFVHVPRAEKDGEKPGTWAELAAGWTYFRRTTWLWAVVLGFGFLNFIQAGAWSTLGPAVAERTFGAQGWGLILSAEAVGLLLMTVILLRVPLRRPLLYGMVGVACLGLPIFMLGAHPNLWWLVPAAFVAGIGTEIFSMGWNLAMQEYVPDEMLSRAYSYDALGSFVAVPLGQLAFGPLAAAYGYTDVLMYSGAAYVVICAVVLSLEGGTPVGPGPDNGRRVGRTVTSRPTSITTPPIASAAAGVSPSNAQAALIETTGTSRIHGTTAAVASARAAS